MKKAAILAAGLGERIQSIAPFKPLLKINGSSLLELTLNNLHFKKFSKTIIIFNDAEKAMDFSLLPSLADPSFHYFFKTTKSSMHSLFEVWKKSELKPNEHLFVSMVDSIVLPNEALKFLEFCQNLKADESAILATGFIEDEKPLTLEVDPDGLVKKFQTPLVAGTLVTSGVYYFSENIFPILEEMINANQVKMRNFLTTLVEKKFKIKVFELNKTLDIDRPEDILSAEKFLNEAL